jgi:hypothetical protein
MSALALPLLALLLVWLVYTITTHALPCLAGLAAARYAFETGSGRFGACVVFGLTAITVFGLMRWLFAVVPHPAARIMLSIALVTPAILTSYFILENLSAGRVPSEPWRQALCTLGAAMFGLAAFGRLSGPESD